MRIKTFTFASLLTLASTMALPQQQWGEAGDMPVPGDYDGDGITDYAVWRPSVGEWYILLSSQNYSPISVQWGESGDIPVPGDYTCSGITDIAVWRPADGYWYVLHQSGITFPNYVQLNPVQWGQNGDVPVPSAYGGGSGVIDFAVWRPSVGNWYTIANPNCS